MLKVAWHLRQNPLCPILKARGNRRQTTKKGVPMNTRHNYFPLNCSRRLGSANLLLFLLFLGCFFLGCHELNASLRRFSCFWSPFSLFEAQRVVSLDAYIHDIGVLMLQCQQKNACRDVDRCFFRKADLLKPAAIGEIPS